MPMNGGTRMLRARRKDINVKPNRRLDRKSSRGMLFENEELRMRTITINAEVEQGQYALKKLRRENEQLRREMWCLRDEYDKMEKLLRKKETDEDTDQENSYSDDNYSQTEDSEDEGVGRKCEKTEKKDGQQMDEAGQGPGKFGNVTTVRSFDGLSVIDEQTEETTTQTTESAAGCGTISRDDSINRTANSAFEEADFPQLYDPIRLTNRKKAFGPYDNDPGYVTCSGWPDNGYDVRPASPYPYTGSLRPSYEKRFRVLQNLPPMVDSATSDNGWVFQNSCKPDYLFPREPFAGVPFIPDKSMTGPLSIRIPEEYIIEDRAGPDVFVSGVCAKGDVQEAAKGEKNGVMAHVEAEINRMDIGEGTDEDAKKSRADDESAKAKSVDDCCEHVEDSVPCQKPGDKHARQDIDSGDMSTADKASTYQSRLMVTLRTPTPRAPKRVPPVQLPRAYVGFKPEYQAPGKKVFAPTEPPGPEPPPKLEAEDIPSISDELGLLMPVDTTLGVPPLKPIKIPPAPPPRTTSCAAPIIPEPSYGMTAFQPRTLRRVGYHDPSDALPEWQSPLVLPDATSSPRMFHRGYNLSLDNLSTHRKITANDESSTEDISVRKLRTSGRTPKQPDTPHLSKSVSSPSFGTFFRRKPSIHSVSSTDNGSRQHSDLKMPRALQHNNVSISSSSGLDSPTKSDRRKRRVSIKFNKKMVPDVGLMQEPGRDAALPGILTVRSAGRGRMRNRNEETDVTTSERERTNSVSSRASSGAPGAGRRKLSVSSNRSYLNDEKIPWCGCWGNGCV